MVRRLDARAPGFAAQFNALLNAKRGEEEDVAQTVRAIIADVRSHGDSALVELSNRFDHAGVSAETLGIRQDEIAAAHGKCSKEALAALDVAATRIEAFHRRQVPENVWYTDEAGAKLGWRWT